MIDVQQPKPDTCLLTGFEPEAKTDILDDIVNRYPKAHVIAANESITVSGVTEYLENVLFALGIYHSRQYITFATGDFGSFTDWCKANRREYSPTVSWFDSGKDIYFARFVVSDFIHNGKPFLNIYNARKTGNYVADIINAIYICSLTNAV